MKNINGFEILDVACGPEKYTVSQGASVIDFDF